MTRKKQHGINKKLFVNITVLFFIIIICYVVESGDTLSSIANKFNTTVTKIMNVNNLSTGTINAGSTLRVPNGTLSTTNSK
ncbi:LysM peptidoglycan-binding domain-containing protein [Liquorilactobacillus cacaonum]|nr:LysM peptidoglycan-binding domain-containing protein [Liquorilactobacillus cacaonum]